MNFLDAHKMIVHDYIDMVVLKQKPNEIGKRVSLLKNTKDEIIDAFKLFYAHMFLFNTRTNDEFEHFETCRWGLSMFIDDALMDEYSECYKMLNDKSIIGRFRNKSAIPSAKERQAELVKQIGSLIVNHYKDEEMDAFIEKVLPLSKEVQKKWISQSAEDQFRETAHFCDKVYEIANIPFASKDFIYFFPFATLRRYANTPNSEDDFGKYKGYIFSHQ